MSRVFRHVLRSHVRLAVPEAYAFPIGALIAPQHTVDQVPQRTPKVLATREAVLIDKQDVMLEAGIEVRLQSKLDDDGVVMAIDVCVDPIKSFEKLAD